MEGCPVLAYEKDPLTGIVRHLDDQCIGCQYCILKCPYDVPKYNSRLGIVRKCDMCSGRLAVGEAPACAQGCPNEAIRITVVDRQKVIDDSEANVFLPGAAEPDYTLPATTFKSSRPLPQNTLPADYYRLSPGHAHLPLVIMLVLTQLSVGAFVIAELMTWNAGAAAMATLRPAHAAVALALGLIALAASILHLGRPLYAFRAIIGLRTSWLSREILAFALFATLAAAYAAISWVAPRALSPHALRGLGVAVAIAGMLGVFCSVMIYHDTRRAFWHARYTAPKFFLSALLLGTVTTLLTMATAAFAQQPAASRLLETTGRAGFGLVAAISALKILLALFPLRHLRDGAPDDSASGFRQHTPMRRTARLAVGPLLRPVLGRFLLAAVGGILLPLLALAALPGAPNDESLGSHAIGKADLLVMAAALFALTLISELLERYLFFAAVVAPKMPGGLGA